MSNPNPPATLDGQSVKVVSVSTTPQKRELGDSWPKGSAGVCFALQMTEPAPNQVSVLATAGGSENFWGYAVVTDFDATITWHAGPVCNSAPPVGAYVLFRNMDIHPNSVTFPPKHPPTSNTDTSCKAYHAT
jgi:hypothetical protein